jgi:hypothetical protein
VHLNDHGNDLMAGLINQYLVYRPELGEQDGERMIRTIPAADLQWRDGALEVPFEGNRVDAILDPAAATGAAEVLIDGKAPSAHPGVYSITRPKPDPWAPLALSRVDHDAPLVVERWTLRVTSVGEDSKAWRFSVAGSVTGPDGEGSSDAAFVSPSGRVRVDPGSWFRNGQVPAGHEITWQVVANCADRLVADSPADASKAVVVTLAQGLENGPHTLRLVAQDGKPVDLKALRIYRPPLLASTTQPSGIN